MPKPSTVASPRAVAAASSGVMRGANTISATISPGGAVSSGMSSGGCPTMPSGVALISRRIGPRASRSAHGHVIRPGNRAASASARWAVRAAIVTAMPASSSAAAMAAAAPPAPRIIAGPIISELTIACPIIAGAGTAPVPRNAATKPVPSVISPTAPSGPKTMVFTAPHRWAIGLRCWHSAAASSLCG